MMTLIEHLLSLGKKLKPVTAHTNNKAVPIDAACPQLIYGVELEIESANSEWVVSGMDVTRYDSLRNGGLEFITLPTTISVLNHVLNNFFGRARVTNDNYSERCSTHIHVNCQDMSLEQIATVCILYQTFESLLFQYVGGDRDKNIFCVPWSEANLTHNMVDKLVNKFSNLGNVGQWQKYTALNLLPLFEYGTVEFRHMPGHGDHRKIIEWCNIIGSMFQYAKTHSLEETKTWIVSLNSTSAYRHTIDQVFGRWADCLRINEYERELEKGVLAVKYSLLEVKKAATVSNTYQDHLQNTFAVYYDDTDLAAAAPIARGNNAAARRERVVARPDVNHIPVDPFTAAAFISEPVRNQTTWERIQENSNMIDQRVARGER